MSTNRAACKNVTKVDVGTPPHASVDWETFAFHFHGFEDIRAERDHAVVTSRVKCFGHEWWLALFPIGTSIAADGMISLFLYKSPGGGPISVKFRINILEYDGCKNADTEFSTGAVMENKFDDTSLVADCHDYIQRSDIIRQDLLVDGTLVVELQMKSPRHSNLPCAPFAPSNSGDKKMTALWTQDEKYCDVVFVFSQGEGTAAEESQKIYAHRAVLQACAPGLFELCEPYDEKPASIPLSNIGHKVFDLLLRHVYGQPILVSEWILHSRDLIDAADCYGVSDLKLEAEMWYVKFTDITATNAVGLLQYADAKNCALLKESVMDYFVSNGRDALRLVSFEGIPESRSLFTDLLLAMSVDNTAREEESSDDYNVMRISRLRRELDDLGLDTDGSRETLIKRLKNKQIVTQSQMMLQMLITDEVWDA